MQALPTDQTGSILTAEQWADQIRQQLVKSLEHVLTAGRLLAEAKAALPYGEWCRMFDEQLLPFRRLTAYRLISIAQCPVFVDVSLVKQLPIGWSVLYELSKIPVQRLRQLLLEGVITPTTSKKKAEAIHQQEQVIKQPAARRSVFDRSRAAVEARRVQISQLAATGASVEQIAAEVNITEGQIKKWIRRDRIDVPAARVTAGKHRISSVRVLEQTIRDAEEVTAGIDLIDLHQLTPDVLRDAVQRLRVASRQIMAFVTRLQDAERKQTYARPAAATTVDIHSSQTAAASIPDLPSSLGPDASATSTGDTTGIPTSTC
jgi:Protein of unknown function (DUF3102)/Homeodomain-like domain